MYDPENDQIWYDSKEHGIVLVEGEFLFLEKEPWNQLKNVFCKTYYVETTVKTMKTRIE